MVPSSKYSVKPLQRNYRTALFLIGALVLISLIAYSWVFVSRQKADVQANLKIEAQQLGLSLDDTIDVVRAHIFNTRRSIEHSLSRPDLADKALTRILRGARDNPVQLQADMGTLHVNPAISLEPKAFERDLTAAATFLSGAAATHQWNSVFQWTYFYGVSEHWFLIYPMLSREELFRATKTNDIASSLRVIFEADGTRPMAAVGPRNNPKREMVWTSPYLDASGKGMMVTLLAPVYLADEFIGAVGTDVTLKALNTTLRSHDLDLGRAMVVDLEGYLVADTGGALDKAEGKVKLAKLFPDAPVAAAASAPDWLKFPLKGTDWVLLIHLPEADLDRHVLSMLLPYFGLAAALIFAIVGLAVLQNRRYAGPALQLAEYVEQCESQPDVPPPQVPVIWRPMFEQVANSARERQELLARTHAQTQELERTVEERTASLSETGDALLKTQHDLLRADRLGALGGMIAGVAGELSALLARAQKATAALHGSLNVFNEQQRLGLRKADLEIFVARVEETERAVGQGVEQAGELIQRLRQLAVDQASEQARSFPLRDIAENVLAVLGPRLRLKGCSIDNRIPEDIEMHALAGTFGQVLHHLLDVAIDRVQAPGLIELTGYLDNDERGDQVVLAVTDNGAPTAELPEGWQVAKALIEESLGGTLEIEKSRVVARLPRCSN